ncbi:MAG: MucB/RseB C-terminal domain-containing protein [Rhodoferax sp.]|nr:MucB/RseB C-terminal domain-containing protein [Rhodoferax sp.]MCF8209662.1 MucB/RseB C-terminal domain-containing protein [Rhodoferax sp.]
MGICLGLGSCWTLAQQGSATDLTLKNWLVRAHEASRYRAYTGTFVVSSGTGLASARIWHVCEGNQQLERVESLSGIPRATFRRNDLVLTLFPQARVAVVENREPLGLFPALLKSNDHAINEFYHLRPLGSGRVAGFDTELVQLQPKDRLRFGYKVWSEKRTGLVMQLQTLDTDGRLLEQSAFSELQLDAPVSVGQLHQMMSDTAGYRVERPAIEHVTADSQGWALRQLVAGFKPTGCFKRPISRPPSAGSVSDGAMQWVFSDGLATVSLFVETFDARRHGREGYTNLGGASHALTRRIDDWWASAVGEVPLTTLMAFVVALERKK